MSGNKLTNFLEWKDWYRGSNIEFKSTVSYCTIAFRVFSTCTVHSVHSVHHSFHRSSKPLLSQGVRRGYLWQASLCHFIYCISFISVSYHISTRFVYIQISITYPTWHFHSIFFFCFRLCFFRCFAVFPHCQALPFVPPDVRAQATLVFALGSGSSQGIACRCNWLCDIFDFTRRKDWRYKKNQNTYSDYLCNRYTYNID